MAPQHRIKEQVARFYITKLCKVVARFETISLLSGVGKFFLGLVVLRV